jgi:hypothetical protein
VIWTLDYRYNAHTSSDTSDQLSFILTQQLKAFIHMTNVQNGNMAVMISFGSPVVRGEWLRTPFEMKKISLPVLSYSPN